MTQSSKPVFLIDSSIYVFRSWFILPDTITDREGNPAHAVYGFTDFVYQFLAEQQPTHIGFAFDESLKTSYRNEIYPEYKANRESAPEELKRQFQYCRAFLRALGFAEFGSDRYEADDIIGTLAWRYRDRGHDIHILTGDKDLAQLIREGDTWWDYARSNRLDSRGIEKRFGVRPEQMADQLAIAGDKTDNIPGVPGIGMATAAKLLKRFDSLDRLLEEIDQISTMKVRGAKRLQDLVTEHRDILPMARKLTGIVTDMELEERPLGPAEPDIKGLDMLTDQLAFSPARKQRWMALAERKYENLRPAD
ncbi:MAG: 5'-3' exonuclease H3TH domain-containing protein [Gammaproteobacteria bacterium]|nr:5'-3' exonuclease H3TH domain-containing protein [Gammaproteobacteria bacterium]